MWGQPHSYPPGKTIEKILRKNKYRQKLLIEKSKD